MTEEDPLAAARGCVVALVIMVGAIITLCLAFVATWMLT